MNRPLEFTTPSHGVALGAYWLAALLGLSFLLPDVNESPAIVEALGRTGFFSWAAGMTFCGALALFCAVACTVDRGRVVTYVQVERVAALGLALTFALYLYALVAPGLADLPPTANAADTWRVVKTTLTTKLLAATYVLGGLARVVQITREVRKWERGVADPHPTTPPPLADPDQ